MKGTDHNGDGFALPDVRSCCPSDCVFVMPQPPQANSSSASDLNDSDLNDSDLNVEAIVKSLRRKEGNWVSWGQACQQLQKAGYSSQSIFEETGFEPIHQNQVIVGAQVYATLVGAPGSRGAIGSL